MAMNGLTLEYFRSAKRIYIINLQIITYTLNLLCSTNIFEDCGLLSDFLLSVSLTSFIRTGIPVALIMLHTILKLCILSMVSNGVVVEVMEMLAGGFRIMRG